MVGFALDVVDAAIGRIVDDPDVRRGETVTYTPVFVAAGLDPPRDLYVTEPVIVTQFMKAIHDRCRERGLPPLDAVVVNAGGPRRGYPGRGYFDANGLADPFGGSAPPEAAIDATRVWQAQRAEVAAWVRTQQ